MDTTEGIAEALVEDLRDNDLKAYLSTLVINEEGIECMIERGSEKVSAKAKKFRNRLDEIRNEAVEDWTKARKEGSSNGVDWSRIESVDVNFKKGSDGELEFADIYVMVTDGSQTFKLKLDDCVKCGGQWFVTDGIRFD